MLKSLYTTKISKTQTSEVFCLYGDLTNFSKISKSCPTENVSVNIMKDFYELSLRILNNSNGLVLNFPGDGFLCVWDKTCPSQNVILAIQNITTDVNKLMRKWKERINEVPVPTTGIKFGAILAYVTFFVAEDDRILNTFGNELNTGARLQQAKENENNNICISSTAWEWLNSKKGFSDSKEIIIEVKGDKAKAYIVPVFGL